MAIAKNAETPCRYGIIAADGYDTLILSTGLKPCAYDTIHTTVHGIIIQVLLCRESLGDNRMVPRGVLCGAKEKAAALCGSIYRSFPKQWVDGKGR